MLENILTLYTPQFSNSNLFSSICFFFRSNCPSSAFQLKQITLSNYHEVLESHEVQEHISWSLFFTSVGIVIVHNWQTCYFCRYISIFQINILRNYSLDFLYQGLNWRILTFGCLVNFYFEQAPIFIHLGIFYGRECVKSPNNFPNLLIFKLKTR